MLKRVYPFGLFVGAVTLACSAPAFAGPPFLTDDPDTTPFHEYEILLFTDGESAPGGHAGAVGLDFNYGAGRDLQLTAAFPLEYEDADDADLRGGLGNVELAAKIRILHQDSFGLDVALFPRVFLPSPTNFGDDHASLLLPVWLGRSGETWSAFGGGGCAINRGGDSQDYCQAGLAVTRDVLTKLHLGAELFHQTADVEGGDANTTLGLGATYDVSETLHLLGYAGANLHRADNAPRGIWYTSLLFTF